MLGKIKNLDLKKEDEAIMDKSSLISLFNSQQKNFVALQLKDPQEENEMLKAENLELKNRVNDLELKLEKINRYLDQFEDDLEARKSLET